MLDLCLLVTNEEETGRVSVDYLIGKSNLMIDSDILDKITTIQKLPEQDREHILFALDAMLRDAKARAAYQ